MLKSFFLFLLALAVEMSLYNSQNVYTIHGVSNSTSPYFDERLVYFYLYPSDYTFVLHDDPVGHLQV